MKVILKQDVEKLGRRGDVVNVAPGFGRNYLIPRKLAEPAPPGKIAEFRRREEERKSRDARMAVQAEEYTATLNKTVLTLAAKAYAFLSGRGFITPEDVKTVGADVLRHRIIVTYEAEAENMSSEDIVKAVFDGVEVP